MSGCGDLIENAGAGVAPALRAVDCMSQQVTTSAFDRLLGLHGALMPALTVVLTLYIAIFALAVLSGRTRLGIGGLTQRMMGVGLVLAFATSWVAYQSVVWTLATGAPDELASTVMGTNGSATQIFANRIDILFTAIGDISDAASPAASEPAPAPAGQAVPAATAPATPAVNAGVSPHSVLWAGATILLLATVGVLVTSRIILALMLALGPVFVVMALFPATRGLFVGWLRATVLSATAPLLAVVGGAFTLELAVPAVNHLAGPEGIDARGAMTFFMIAAVHAALMFMALRTASTIVGAWQVFPASMTPPAGAMPGGANSYLAPAPAIQWTATGRSAGGTATDPSSSLGAAALPPTSRSHSRLVITAPSAGATSVGSDGRSAANDGGQDGSRRANGIGSRFRAPPERRRLR